MIDPLSSFFDHYYRRRPVNATFTGIHDHDACLPDWSASGLASMGDEMRQLLAAFADRYPSPKSAIVYRENPELLDAELIRAFLEIQLSENDSTHGPRGNPALWTGEAVFSVISLMIADRQASTSGELLSARVESAVARMNAIPGFLEQARESLGEQPLPAPWTAKALRDCEGAEVLFTRGVRLWSDSNSVPAAASAAASAFRDFATWLQAQPAAADMVMQCGSAHYELLLRRGHQCLRSRSDLLADATLRLDVERRRLDEMAREASGSWANVQERLAADHPTPESYLRTFAEEWHACRRVIVDANIVTWPDWPIRYEEIPPFTRDAAPYLYYLFYRSPAPFDPYVEHRYVVTPLPSGDPEPHLRTWNRSVIRLNHVLHHGGVGHHVQNWHAYHRAESRVGKIAAVDCANRIGMFCGGTMAEGWACYATGLMGEIGGLSSLELVSEQHSRIRQLARAVMDLSFHAGEMSFGEAAAFFADRTGVQESVARAEAVKCSMFPGTAVMYWLGTQGILDLRDAMRGRLGNEFSLKRFHDALLGYGSIPVPLVARMMTGGEA